VKFVLDSSVSLRWLLRDADLNDQSYANQVLENLLKDEAYVPSIWWGDITNAIYRSEKSDLLSQTEGEQFFRLLENLPINEHPLPGAQLLRKALDLARQHALSVARAEYLALSILESVPLATVDEELCKLAQLIGVQVYEPQLGILG
jgi:predicted nucleic acid-binding protein